MEIVVDARCEAAAVVLAVEMSVRRPEIEDAGNFVGALDSDC